MSHWPITARLICVPHTRQLKRASGCLGDERLAWAADECSLRQTPHLIHRDCRHRRHQPEDAVDLFKMLTGSMMRTRPHDVKDTRPCEHPARIGARSACITPSRVPLNPHAVFMHSSSEPITASSGFQVSVRRRSDEATQAISMLVATIRVARKGSILS